MSFGSSKSQPAAVPKAPEKSDAEIQQEAARERELRELTETKRGSSSTFLTRKRPQGVSLPGATTDLSSSSRSDQYNMRYY